MFDGIFGFEKNSIYINVNVYVFNKENILYKNCLKSFK